MKGEIGSEAEQFEDSEIFSSERLSILHREYMWMCV